MSSLQLQSNMIKTKYDVNPSVFPNDSITGDNNREESMVTKSLNKVKNHIKGGHVFEEDYGNINFLVLL